MNSKKLFKVGKKDKKKEKNRLANRFSVQDAQRAYGEIPLSKFQNSATWIKGNLFREKLCALEMFAFQTTL